MATYKEIQQWIKQKYGYVPKSCWIAHVKELSSLNPRVANNRYDPAKREKPCPPHKIEHIKNAFRYYKLID